MLHEALDPRTPLLERVRFLGIFSSNLDEYFMKRVGGLKQQIASNVREMGPDGAGSPRQQLAAVNAAVRPQMARQRRPDLWNAYLSKKKADVTSDPET